MKIMINQSNSYCRAKRSMNLQHRKYFTTHKAITRKLICILCKAKEQRNKKTSLQQQHKQEERKTDQDIGRQRSQRKIGSFYKEVLKKRKDTVGSKS